MDLYYYSYGVFSNSDSKDSQISLEKLKLGIGNYIKENGINTEFLRLKGDNFDFDKIVNFLMMSQSVSNKLNECNQKTFKLINKPYDNKKLENKAKQYIENNQIHPLSETNVGIDLGNGLFDKVPKQQTGNCWLHAGINSLLNTEVGRTLLESNRYYDPATGVFAIHLQEAEDNNLHDGIYIITPDDIKSRSSDLSTGEGDITAYIIAVERYFEEARTKDDIEKRPKQFNNIGEGNLSFRFFEIITGGKSTLLSMRSDNPTIKLDKGISWHDNESITFDEIYEMIAKENCACVITVGNPFKQLHALSIVGVKNGNLLIQESNRLSNFHKIYKSIDGTEIFYKSDDYNGAPTFELTKENYKYIHQPAILKYI